MRTAATYRMPRGNAIAGYDNAARTTDYNQLRWAGGITIDVRAEWKATLRGDPAP